MSIQMPWNAAEFFSTLPITSLSFDLVRQSQINNLGGGEVMLAELAPAYWRGSVDLAPMRRGLAAEISAKLTRLEAPDGVFEAYKAHQIGPAADPLGAGLASAAPVLEEIDPADRHQIKLRGLPSGYVLSAGDFLAFDYDPGTGARRALHRVVAGAAHGVLSATPGGAYTSAGFLCLAPEVRPGAALGTAVQLVKPHCLSVLVPGSVSYGITRGAITSGISFEFRQKLRA